MKRVAIFGNAGAGKSTLAWRLAGLTQLPLYPLDLIQFIGGGGEALISGWKAVGRGDDEALALFGGRAEGLHADLFGGQKPLHRVGEGGGGASFRRRHGGQFFRGVADGLVGRDPSALCV